MNYLQTSFWKLLDRGEQSALDETAVKQVLESLLFVSGNEGITAKQAAEVLRLPENDVKSVLYELQADFNQFKRGIQIIELAGTFQYATRPEHAIYLERLADEPQHAGLSQAALETLAIVAYRQPITRLEIEEIRGVKSERALQTLVHKQLIQEAGRTQGPGRPILYGTTREFLNFFGLKDLSQLPAPSDELLLPEVQDEARLLFADRETAAGAPQEK